MLSGNSHPASNDTPASSNIMLSAQQCVAQQQGRHVNTVKGAAKAARKQKAKEKAEKKRLAKEAAQRDKAASVAKKAAAEAKAGQQDRNVGADNKKEETDGLTKLSFQSQDVMKIPLQVFELTATLRVLDLSRNNLRELPAAIGTLRGLVELDVSRNHIMVLPVEIGQLSNLASLNLLSNALRPPARSLPLDALAALPRLRLLDLRYNEKVKGVAAEAVATRLPACEVRVTGPGKTCAERKEAGGDDASVDSGNSHTEHAGDRDATLLRSQLEPYSTPTLRRRLQDEFGVDTDPETVDREQVMLSLLACYEKEGLAPRPVRRMQGTQVSEGLQASLLGELRQWRARTCDFPRERPKISAQGYMILRSPAEFSKKDGAKATLAAAKLAKNIRLWELAHAAMEEVDPSFAPVYTALAITYGFVGSPHIDTQNIGPFYGLSLGDFPAGTGGIRVEWSAREVAEVDTKGRLGKVDGRYPHWVSPYEGERFSVIYYQTLGDVTPKTIAVLPTPPNPNKPNPN